MEDNSKVSETISLIFNVIIVITMFLCFFSLCASMSANLLDQTKEIGILRAIGITKTRIKVLYFYESFILVLASSMLGVMIGTVVGFTLVVQRAVFSDIPIQFHLPMSQIYMILGASLICAFASTWGPSTNLVKNEISAIFRKA